MNFAIQGATQRFPAGTSVGAYLKSQWPQSLLSGAPQGAAVVTATVQTDGSLTFTSLAEGTEYVAYASVSGSDRYMSFVTGATASTGSGAMALAATPVKNANYTAAAGDFVPVDTTSGPVTITLPSAPADKTRIGVKVITLGGSNTVTIARGGTDIFNKAGGSTSLSLSLLNQSAMMQYDAGGGIWYVQSTDVPVSGLDSRYPLLSTVTTKGDLVVATGSGAVARKGAGADGRLLGADSTQTDGLSWLDLGLFVYKAGLYYTAASAGAGTASFATGTAMAIPMPVSKKTPLDRLGAEVSTLLAGGTAELGIYADNGSGYPGARLFSAGAIDCSTIGNKELTIAQTLSPGLYWLAILPLGTGSIGFRRITASMPPVNIGAESGAICTSQTPVGFTQAGLAALPANWTATVASTQSAVKAYWRAA